MLAIYVILIQKNIITLEEVPPESRDKVKEMLQATDS